MSESGMVLNLEFYSCRHLLFAGRCPLTQELVQRLKEGLQIDMGSRRRALLSEKFRPATLVHSLQLTLKKRTSLREDMLEIEFHFDAAKASRHMQLEEKPYLTQTALETMGAVTDNIEFDCSALFLYGGDAVKSLFPIRFGLPEVPDRSFDEIRGISAVKMSDGKEIYKVYLESTDLKELHLEIDFNIPGLFSLDLPQAILEEAHKIASRFVVR